MLFGHQISLPSNSFFWSFINMILRQDNSPSIEFHFNWFIYSIDSHSKESSSNLSRFRSHVNLDVVVINCWGKRIIRRKRRRNADHRYQRKVGRRAVVVEKKRIPSVIITDHQKRNRKKRGPEAKGIDKKREGQASKDLFSSQERQEKYMMKKGRKEKKNP